MREFRGCFKEIAKKDGDFYYLYEFRLMSAPNRYRKMQSIFKTDNEGKRKEYYIEYKEYNPKVIELQKKDFPDIPNPIGMQFDLFDTYIAWVK